MAVYNVSYLLPFLQYILYWVIILLFHEDQLEMEPQAYSMLLPLTLISHSLVIKK